MFPMKTTGVIDMSSHTAGFDVHGNHLTLQLGAGEVIGLEGDARGAEIRSVYGRLWVTQADDGNDHIVEAAERFQVWQPGSVVLQALDEALVVIDAPRAA
jgi:hypothetical protein